MAVHTQDEKLTVIRTIFEARYDEGARFFDRRGEAILRIRSIDPLWVVSQVGFHTTRLIYANDWVLNFGIEKIDVTSVTKTHPAEAEKVSQRFAAAAEAVYHAVVEAIRVPNTIRLGVRYAFAAPADSVEDADAFVCKGSVSPWSEALRPATQGQLRDANLAYVFEDVETGYRCRIELASMAAGGGHLPMYTGLTKAGHTGFVVFDVDRYTRPPTGHFHQTAVFVQEAFLKARRLAREGFDWLLRQQKGVTL